MTVLIVMCLLMEMQICHENAGRTRHVQECIPKFKKAAFTFELRGPPSRDFDDDIIEFLS